jgi:hypothetical protein
VHLALNFDVSAEVTEMFIDGVSQGILDYSDRSDSFTNEHALFLATNANNPGGQRFNGQIDDFGLWSRLLTQQEISEIHTNGLMGRNLQFVPEPSAAALAVSVMLGVLGVAGLTRRRRGGRNSADI